MFEPILAATINANTTKRQIVFIDSTKIVSGKMSIEHKAKTFKIRPGEPVSAKVNLYVTNNIINLDETDTNKGILVSDLKLWKTFTITNAYKWEDIDNVPICQYLIFEIINDSDKYPISVDCGISFR